MPLTAHGEEQAEGLGGSLSGVFACAFHSDLERSQRTLSLALSNSSCTVGAACADTRLAERSMGVLEGAPSRPLPAYDAGDLSWAPVNGEPYIDVAQRIMSFLLDLKDAATISAQRFLVSTHVGPMRVLVGILEEIESPTEVMTSSYANAVPWHGSFSSINWPAFVERDLLA